MGSPGAKASASGSPSAGKADFVLTQTHLFFASLGQHLFGCTAEKAGRIFQCISEFMSDFGPYNQGLGRSIFFGAPLGTDEARAREKIHLSRPAVGSRVWMAGPDLTAADIVAYPGLKLLLRASPRSSVSRGA
jgi:hypothetical protein